MTVAPPHAGHGRHTSDRSPQPGAGSPRARPDDLVEARTRMPLLDLISAQALDEDYDVAAERRALGDAAGQAPSRQRPLVVAVVVAVFGALLALAFVQSRTNADIDSASRSTLIRQVENQRTRLENQQRRLATLRGRVTELTQAGQDATASLQSTQARIRQLGLGTGVEEMVGEGVRVVVNEAPNADQVTKVHDDDLALLINGLWEAKADGIAVNGQRVTPLTAIRASGSAIEINGVGIAPPYTVSAIGNNAVLLSRLLQTQTGVDFVATADYYGFTYTTENVDRITLPAAPARATRLRSANVGSFGTGGGREEESP